MRTTLLTTIAMAAIALLLVPVLVGMERAVAEMVARIRTAAS